VTIIVLVLIIVSGCVPVLEYRRLQKKLSDETTEKARAKQETKLCLERNKNLIEASKSKPAPAEIGQSELEAIKKKAFEEAERKYKAGVIEGQQKDEENKR